MEDNTKALEALEAERKELRLLINKGISFTVDYTEKQKVKIPRFQWCKWLKKHKPLLRISSVSL